MSFPSLPSSAGLPPGGPRGGLLGPWRPVLPPNAPSPSPALVRDTLALERPGSLAGAGGAGLRPAAGPLECAPGLREAHGDWTREAPPRVRGTTPAPAAGARGDGRGKALQLGPPLPASPRRIPAGGRGRPPPKRLDRELSCSSHLRLRRATGASRRTLPGVRGARGPGPLHHPRGGLRIQTRAAVSSPRAAEASGSSAEKG